MIDGAAEAAVPVLDTAALSELAAAIGGDMAVRVIAPARERIADLASDLARNTDRALFAGHAHDLISLAGSLGCIELTTGARRLSAALLAGDPAASATDLVAAARALAALADHFAS